jgi:hypothetical protein
MDLYYFVWTQKAASVLALDDCVQEDLETYIDDCFLIHSVSLPRESFQEIKRMMTVWTKHFYF